MQAGAKLQGVRNQGHRDLIAWQKAMELVKDIYRVTQRFPRSELVGLTGQLRRAAVSVPSNLAEGHGRTSRKEFHQFVAHARGSILEVETQLEIAGSLGYLAPADTNHLMSKAQEIARLLNGLLVWCDSQSGTRS